VIRTSARERPTAAPGWGCFGAVGARLSAVDLDPGAVAIGLTAEPIGLTAETGGLTGVPGGLGVGNPDHRRSGPRLRSVCGTTWSASNGT